MFKWLKYPLRFLYWTTITFALFSFTQVYAAQLVFEWDDTNEVEDGYRLYMRVEGKAYDYTSPVWEGEGTTCTLKGLEPNTYYFVARAYAASDESIDSNEVEYKVVVNSEPVSEAGIDQTVTAGTQVALDGTGSTDSDGTIAGYQWTQTSGPSVSLSSSTNSQPTFTAPSVTESTALSFQLTVTDNGGLTGLDTCQVTIVPVAPTDSGGDGVSDGQEVSETTDPAAGNSGAGLVKIWMEAEDADLNVPMQIMDDSEASSGGYIEVPNGEGNASSPSLNAGYAQYSFDVPVNGDYIIWGRVLALTGVDDSFFIAVDEQDAALWYPSHSADWTWQMINDRSIAGTEVHHLAAGRHTLTVYQREDGTKIDRILIVNDANYIPEGQGERIAPTSTNIWIEAENGSLNFPMQIIADSGASSGGYIEVPNGQGNASSPSLAAGYAQYTFNVPVNGDYIIWGRVLALTGVDDSFFIAVDEQDAALWYPSHSDDWTWQMINDRSIAGTEVHHLAAGTHTLTVYQREDGTQLDRILVTDDYSYVPEGKGEDEVVINTAPQSDAGPSQSVDEGLFVTLDGSGSIDTDGEVSGYLWTQTSGPSVNLNNPTSMQATFTAPSVTESTNLSFQLVVTDNGGLTDSDTCMVTVLPVAPKDSDNDGLSDADESSVYGTDPYSVDSDGDGLWDGQEVSDGTDPTSADIQSGYAKIWIEAEDGDLSLPMQIMDDPDASSGTYVEVPNGQGNASRASLDAGYAQYTFDVPVDGDYVIWCRVLAPTGKDDSFFVSIDQQQAGKWYLSVSETWTWQKLKNKGSKIHYFTSDSHTLTVYQREDGTRIDRILITNEENYVPEGQGESVVPPLANIWIEAEAGNLNSPMQIMDDPEASSGSYIEVPNGQGNASSPSLDDGYAQYTFVVPTDGNYIIWCRVLALTGIDDSFFIGVDDQPAALWYPSHSDDWIWQKTNDRAIAGTEVHLLTAGTHKLTIYQREDGTKIDRILITEDADFVPQD